MENMGEWEQNNLINELTQGRELAKQLQVHLNAPSSSSSSSSHDHHQSREMLVQNILSSYEKALSMLNFSSSAGLVIESPPSLSGSPRSEDSDRDVKDQEHKDSAKKRKTLQRWTQQVRVSPGTGLEGPLDDGFSWRKYGQKDILGAKYPRGYYRCTHRYVQGCLATKQVQRSDEDPTIFEITYRGNHTCNQAAKSAMNLPTSAAQPENQDQAKTNSSNSNIIEPPHEYTYYHQTPHQQQHHHQPEDALMNLRNGLKVVTEDLDIHHQQAFPPFHFASTSNINADQTKVFSPSSTVNNNFTGFSPSFISPATSETNYFSPSPSAINISAFQGNESFQSPDQSSELNEIISAATSTTNSPTVGLDFPFGNIEHDPNFTFDNLGFFSSFQPFEK